MIFLLAVIDDNILNYNHVLSFLFPFKSAHNRHTQFQKTISDYRAITSTPMGLTGRQDPHAGYKAGLIVVE